MLLLDHLIEKFPTAKRQTLKQMIVDGRVTVNGKIANRLKLEILPQDLIRVDPSAPSKSSKARSNGSPIPIVFEDADILVIDKPAGLLTSTVPTEQRPTALVWVRRYAADAQPPARIGLVHRLDRDASGLLVFSKNSRAHESLKRQFFNHEVSRVYLAVVAPPPRKKHERIESALVEYADGSVHSTRLAGRGRNAITEYSVICRWEDRATLRVVLETGRKHQIRAHLSELGCPIIGDSVYGGKPDQSGLMLAAVELALDHPRTGKRRTFRIDPPDRMTPLL